MFCIFHYFIFTIIFKGYTHALNSPGRSEIYLITIQSTTKKCHRIVTKISITSKKITCHRIIITSLLVAANNTVILSWADYFV